MNILIGLARNKIAALLLGPAGIGTIGVLLNLVTTVASLAGLGVAMSVVRALASATNDDARSQIRRTVGVLVTLLAMAGGIAIWLLRVPIARHVLNDANLAWQVGQLAPAVSFTVWSAMQIALLNGWRRLGDLARAQVGGAAFGTVLGIFALLAWGDRGISAFVVAAPLGMVASGLFYTARLPRFAKPITLNRATRHEMTRLIGLGIPMMMGGLAMPLGLLVIRAMLGDRLGAVALGQFTAAWTLSATYVGFVLAAMGTDYFPRLSAVIGDHEVARRMVNDQTEVALLFALPVMFGLQGTAPWLIRLLYSDAFTPAVAILQWQIAGDVLKLASWPLAFVILAQGRGKVFWAVEVLFMIVMASAIHLLMDGFGLMATGIGYFLAYMVYLPVLLIMTQKVIGFRMHRRIFLMIMIGLLGVALIALIDHISNLIALALAAGLSAATCLYSYLRINRRSSNSQSTVEAII